MYIDKILDPLSTINDCIDFHGRYVLIGHHPNSLYIFDGFDGWIFVRNKIKIYFPNASAGIIFLVAFYVCAVFIS
ncbi:hypothetical protein D3C86_1718640 [compost metagenome]